MVMQVATLHSRTAVLVLLLASIVLFGAVPTNAKKDLPVHPMLPEPILDAMACDACAYTMINIQLQVQALREQREAQGLKVREDEILTIIEKVCNPFKEEGEWIRRVEVKVNPKSQSQPLSTVVMDYFSACKSTCTSISSICERAVDDEEADKIPALMLRLLKTASDISGESLRDQVVRSVCHSMEMCEKHDLYQRQLAEVLKHKASRAQVMKAIREDAPVKIDAQEMEVERMIHSMTKEEGRKTDIFPRDEIQQLQAAIRAGDKDRVAEIDPAVGALTDEEFKAVRAMLTKEDLGADMTTDTDYTGITDL